jgi:mRNA interferase RelE/StbE
MKKLNSFDESFRKLDPISQKKIRKAIRLMAEDLRHPSLQAGKLEGRKYIWYCRADRDLRITFHFDDQGDIVLRNCGHHDPTLRKP